MLSKRCGLKCPQAEEGLWLSLLERHFNDLLLRTRYPNFFYGSALKAVMLVPLLKLILHVDFCHNLKNSLFLLTGLRHYPLLLLVNSIFHQSAHSHLLLQNPSLQEEFPLPLLQGSTSSSTAIPKPVGSQCQFLRTFAGLAIDHVKTDQALPIPLLAYIILARHNAGSTEHIYKCIQRFRCQTHMPAEH